MARRPSNSGRPPRRDHRPPQGRGSAPRRPRPQDGPKPAPGTEALGLWRRWLDEPRFVPLDRWLARHANPRTRDAPSPAVVQRVFGLARWGALARFAKREGAGLSADASPAKVAAALDRLERATPTGEAWREALLAAATEEGLKAGRQASRGEGDPARALRRAADSGDWRARALAAGLPLQWAEDLQLRAGRSGWTDAELAGFLKATAKRPPLHARLVDLARADEAVTSLQDDGFTVTRLGAEAGGDGPPGALMLVGKTAFDRAAARKAGLVEGQDLASQRVGHAVEARRGERVWDVCAGAGGKTLQLAQQLEGRGALVATDVNERVLKALKQRVKRAGYQMVRTMPWGGPDADGDAGRPPWPREVASRGGYDRVLVDAPCSATGTWRRNPDARFRVDADRLAELCGLQERLLATAAGAVRTGGTLVYATCSVRVAENEAVAEAFEASAAAAEFVRDGAGDGGPVGRILGAPAEDAETFFVVRWRREASTG